MAAVQPETPAVSLRQKLLRRKPVGVMSAETGADTGGGELARTIGLFQLTLFGVGATIGTGIFVILTEAVPTAGPAVILSFVMAGVVAGLTAICYAELAGAVPVSGSSYSYAYATLGEAIAMVVAACLLLEYGVSAAGVAVGWSQYVNELLDNLFGFTIPDSISQAPEQGGVFNLPAVVLIWLCTLLLLRGASESAKVNAIMVMIKLGVLALFVVIGLQGWDSDHLSNFAPDGFSGINAAAGIIFFSYIGLDAVSTAGEEVKDPRRNLPLAIIGALVIVTTIYVAVAVVAVAAQPVDAFNGQEAGLSNILESVTGSTWPASVLAAGAVVSIFSVTLVVIYGQTRILFAMSRDGMIPQFFHKLNPRTLMPVRSTFFVAILISLLAGVIPINFLFEMTSIGTLVAFLVVSIGVMVLRHTQPDLPRGFKVPLYPGHPDPSIVGCFWIIKDLRAVTIYVFLIWTSRGAGLVLLLRHRATLASSGKAQVMTMVVGIRAGRARPRGPAPGRDARPLGRRGPGRVRGRPGAVAAEPGEGRRGVPGVPAGRGRQRAEPRARAAARRCPRRRSRSYHARSAAAGLLEVAERVDASADRGRLGRRRRLGDVALGSASARLLHSSHVPVALAPRGFRAGAAARV